MLLTVRGRWSGLPRTFPIALLELDGRRFVQSPFGEVNWVHNLRAAGQAVVSKGRGREQVDAIEVVPEEGARCSAKPWRPYLRSRVLRPVLRRFFHFRTDSTLDEYVAQARTHPMFELLSRPAGPYAGNHAASRRV